MGRSISQAEGTGCVMAQCHAGSAFFQKEKGASVVGAGARRVKSEIMKIQENRPHHVLTKTVRLQLFSNLAHKLTAASQNSRQCLQQEFTKILPGWIHRCIFLDTGPERGGLRGAGGQHTPRSPLPIPVAWSGGVRNVPVALAPGIIFCEARAVGSR